MYPSMLRSRIGTTLCRQSRHVSVGNHSAADNRPIFTTRDCAFAKPVHLDDIHDYLHITSNMHPRDRCELMKSTGIDYVNVSTYFDYVYRLEALFLCHRTQERVLGWLNLIDIDRP